jgi:hypothetical protein
MEEKKRLGAAEASVKNAEMEKFVAVIFPHNIWLWLMAHEPQHRPTPNEKSTVARKPLPAAFPIFHEM